MIDYKIFKKVDLSFLIQKKNLISYFLIVLIFSFDRISKIKIINEHLDQDRFYINDHIVAVTYVVNYFFEATNIQIMLALYDLKGNPLYQANKKENGHEYFPLEIASSSLDETTLCKFSKLNVFEKTILYLLQ